MWTVITTDVFNEWLEQQDESTQEKVLAALVNVVPLIRPLNSVL